MNTQRTIIIDIDTEKQIRMRRDTNEIEWCRAVGYLASWGRQYPRVKIFDGEQLAVLKKINQIVWEVCGWDEDDNPYADRRFKYSMTVGNRNKAHVNTAKEVAK